MATVRQSKAPSSMMQIGLMHQADCHLLHRFTEHPPPKEQALMPTFPDKEAAKHISRPARKQPSPDPRLQPSATAIANRAAEVGTLFSKPGASIS